VLAELCHSRDAGVAVIHAPVVLAFGIAAAGEGGRQSLRPAAFLASLPASQAFWPRSAAASAPFAVFSAVHFVDGGLPHVCPISAQPTATRRGAVAGTAFVAAWGERLAGKKAQNDC
jgi:hypothetical protein